MWMMIFVPRNISPTQQDHVPWHGCRIGFRPGARCFELGYAQICLALVLGLQLAKLHPTPWQGSILCTELKSTGCSNQLIVTDISYACHWFLAILSVYTLMYDWNILNCHIDIEHIIEVTLKVIMLYSAFHITSLSVSTKFCWYHILHSLRYLWHHDGSFLALLWCGSQQPVLGHWTMLAAIDQRAIAEHGHPGGLGSFRVSCRTHRDGLVAAVYLEDLPNMNQNGLKLEYSMLSLGCEQILTIGTLEAPILLSNCFINFYYSHSLQLHVCAKVVYSTLLILCTASLQLKRANKANTSLSWVPTTVAWSPLLFSGFRRVQNGLCNS